MQGFKQLHVLCCIPNSFIIVARQRISVNKHYYWKQFHLTHAFASSIWVKKHTQARMLKKNEISPFKKAFANEIKILSKLYEALVTVNLNKAVLHLFVFCTICFCSCCCWRRRIPCSRDCSNHTDWGTVPAHRISGTPKHPKQ